MILRRRDRRQDTAALGCPGAVLLALARVVLAQSPPAMFAHYIDMGQADCTLIEFPCGAILIDAGSQDDAHTQELIAYLDEFFDDHPSLNRTLESVIITHNHIDHTKALPDLIAQRNAADPGNRITIKRVLDNGKRDGMGAKPIRDLAAAISAGNSDIQLRGIADAAITALPDPTGLTDADIDPLSCPTCDPEIRILSGGFDEDPGWPSGAFENHNNHSLVVRIDFGESTFLFSGDLEEPAIETLVDFYDGSSMLDVDVYHVGHHGSANGTTEPLLNATTPHIAVISMGGWEFGRKPDGSARPFTTFAYGHPRLPILDMLAAHIPGNRSRPRAIMAATGGRHFEEYTVRKRIYGTGFDGNVTVRATTNREFRVTVEHPN